MVHVCIFLPWVANGWVSMDDCNGVFLGYSRKVFSFLMPLPPPHSNHMCVVSLRVLFCGTNANVDLHFLLRFWHVCYIHKNTTPIIHKLQLWVSYECQRRRQYENLGSCHESIWNIKGDDQGPTVTWSMSFVHDIHPMCFMIKKCINTPFWLSTGGLGLRSLDNGQPKHLVVNQNDLFYVFSCDELQCLSLDKWLQLSFSRIHHPPPYSCGLLNRKWLPDLTIV